MSEHESNAVEGRGERADAGCSCAEMKRRTRASYRSFKGGDVESTVRNWAPNARFFISGENILRWAGLQSGPDEIRDSFAEFDRDLKVILFVPLILFCVGSVVVSFGFYRLQCRQSGRRFSGLFLHFLRFNAECQFVDVTSLFNARRVRRNCPATARR